MIRNRPLWIWLGLALILLGAAVLRWTGLDWDGYNHYHPDERYITWVATTIERPDNWRTALIPTQSTINPFYWPPGAESSGIEVPEDERRDFAYGHVPLYLGVAATRLVEVVSPPLRSILPTTWLVTADLLNGRSLVEFRHLTAVSRALTGLFDLGTIIVLFLLGRRVYGAGVALLAAAFLALNVMHIQLAHFFAVDPYLTFFVVTAVYFFTRSVDRGVWSAEREMGKGALLLGAMFVGLAVGAKFAAILLIVPLMVTIWLGGEKRRLLWWITVVAVAAFTFIIANPFALLDFGCEAISPVIHIGPINIPAINWKSCYLENIFTQGAMVRGGSDLGFTRQYAGTWPYLYYIEMQLRWGMGWFLGMVAFVGFGWAVWQEVTEFLRQRRQGAKGSYFKLHTSNFILLSWTVPYFLATGSFYVKFMRYLQPLTPFLMLYAAALLWELRGRWRYVGAMVVLGVTAVYALAFVNIYTVDHPWNIASRWIYENVPSGTLIASEQWDDALPTTMLVDGRLRRRGEYRDEQLTWLTGPDNQDDAEKLAENLILLAEAEYVTLVSNRVYGVVPRLAERYPLSTQYHQLLLNGDMGYEPVFVNTRMPNLLGINLLPDSFVWPGLRPSPLIADYLDTFLGINNGRFDESFTVYDQPLVMIFKNVAGLSAEEMQAFFDLEN